MKTLGHSPRGARPLVAALVAALLGCATEAPNPVESWAGAYDGGAPAHDATPPPAHEPGVTCDDAVALPSNAALTGQALPHAGTPDTTCIPSDAPRRFYAFMLPAGHRAVVTVESTSLPAWRPVARMRRACDERTCVASGTAPATFSPVTLVYDNDNVDAVRKVVEVSAMSAAVEGTFEINLWIAPLAPPPSPACASAVALTPGATITDAVPTGSPPPEVCPAGDAPQRFYSLTVPPGVRAVVGVRSPYGSGQPEPVIRVLASCEAADCLAVDRTTGAYFSPAVGVDNWDSSPRSVIIAAGHFLRTPATLPLNVTARFEALPPAPAPNADCGRALPVTPSDVPLGYSDPRPVAGDTRDGTDVDLACSDAGHAGGKALYYAITAPPRRTLRAWVRGWHLRARLLDRCGATTCLGSEGGTHEDSSDWPAQYHNASDTPRDLVLAVAARNGAQTPDFTLGADLLPPPPNLTCATASPLTVGTTTAGNDAFGTERASQCLAALDGPSAWYSVAVPPGHVLDLDARASNPPFNPVRATPVVRVVRGCDATTCLAASADGRVAWLNTGAAPVDARVAIGAPSAADAGDFFVSARVLPIENNVCARAVRVYDGAVLRGQSTQNGFQSPPACGSTATGQVVYYVAAVPAGQELVVRTVATGPDPMFPARAVVRLLGAGGAATCLAPVPAGDEQQVERYLNATGDPRDVVIAIGGEARERPSVFDLVVSIGAPAT